MNQTAEIVVGCFGIVHVIEQRDVYKTKVSVYKKGGTAMIRPLHVSAKGFLFAEEFVRVEEFARSIEFGRIEDTVKNIRRNPQILRRRGKAGKKKILRFSYDFINTTTKQKKFSNINKQARGRTLL